VDLIIAAYADTIMRQASNETAVKALESKLYEFVPKDVLIHLLPFWPSAGDGGFSLNSRSRTDLKLATWVDIKQLSARYRLIVDGVFNHVGVDHDWFRSFRLKAAGDQRI
jgi:hypothetical protein